MLKNRWRTAGAFVLCLLCFALAQGSSLTGDARRQLNHSGAAFRGLVEDLESFEAEGHIYTRFYVSNKENFKGKVPSRVAMISRGGQVAGKGEVSSSSFQFRQGEERVFFVTRNANGKGPLAAAETVARPVDAGVLAELRSQTRGGALAGADLTTAAADTAFDPAAGGSFTNSLVIAEGLSGPNAPSSSATNLMTGLDDGLPARLLQPDSGKAIPYLIDQDYLPAGISASQAVWAVSTALNSWANTCSAKFQFKGITSFGKPASDVDATDGVLRIQLHDIYNRLQGLGELGEGGHAWVAQNTSGGWTTGGRVAGNDFHKVVRAFVTLKHNDPVMQKLTSFVEVLTHEVGHALGLAHSSEVDPEPSPVLRESIMYYRVHDDGRGAAVTEFDANAVRQVHPWNTPPVCFDRFLDVVTGTTVAGANTFQMHAFDLQGTAVSLQMDSQTGGNGQFTMGGSKITYTPNAAWPDTARFDPAGAATTAYDMAYVRCGDGANSSPWVNVAVLSFNKDTHNEGIPDWWRLTYMGGTGAGTHANEDFDGDGVSNFAEWRLGSDPGRATSKVGIKSFTSTNLTFEGRAYDSYDIYTSPDLVNWTRDTIQPTNSNGVYTLPGALGSRGFFKLERVQ